MGKRSTRKQRIIRALTPRRVRRVATRWRRRKQKLTRSYARVREVVRRDPRVKCGACGMQVAPGKLKGHLARHEAQDAKAGASRRHQPKARPPAPAPRARKAAAEPQQAGCDGTCKNSDMDPDEAEAKGLCGMCAGRKELVTNFGGKHVHVPCPECGGSGRTKGRSKTGSKGGGTAAGQGAPAQEDEDPQRPSRGQAVTSSMGWCAAGSVLCFAFTVFGAPWLAVAGIAAVAIGAGAYAHERRHGVSDHGSRSDRAATKQAARAAGCSSACMWSIRPADTCRCPCGGSTHGIGHRKKAAA